MAPLLDGFLFTKMQGVGNDFVVVDEAAWPDADGPDAGWPARAITLCDRRFGVGADGLLVLGPSSVADLRMRMFNPDGTEDMCGNGLRCVIHLAQRQGRVGATGTAETLAGVRRFSTNEDGRLAVAMGRPRFAPPDLPMCVSESAVPDGRVLDFPLVVGDEIVPVSVVSTGTTHTVLFVDELPGDARFLHLSPRIENHPLFPERTSVLWTQVIGPDRLQLRIWERGVGETLGCGTGACAAAVLARVQNRVSGSPIRVDSRGGTLSVAWDGKEDAMLLIGPAEIVFTSIRPITPPSSGTPGDGA